MKKLQTRSRPFAEFLRKQGGRPPLEIVGHFFRVRESPKFFADLERIRANVVLIQNEHPTWKENTLRLAREHCNRGLRLYAIEGPVLRPGFPWERLEPGPGNDKLYRRRPQRFAFAPRLALAALYGEQSDSILIDLLQDWKSFAASDRNAVAYDTNLVVIQRLLALSWAWAFLAAREEPIRDRLEQEGLLLKVIHADVEYLAPRLGASPPNNHLLADAFAGWFIGCIWPEFLSGKPLLDKFGTLWLRELERQTLSDGTSFEHSTHYHEFACEMAAAYVILSQRNGHVVPEWVLERTSRLLEFQARLAGTEGTTVAIGDGAEDPFFPLDGGDGWGTAAWRELHRVLFPSGLAAPSVHRPSEERAFWLSGGGLATDDGSIEPSSSCFAYPLGGFYLLEDSPRHSRLVFRTGPRQGEPVFAGHAHADLLSVYAMLHGRPFIVDAGTYSYRAVIDSESPKPPDWRNYLRGPAAHNSLAIESVDPLGACRGDFRSPALETFVTTEKSFSEAVGVWVDAVVVGGPYASYRRGVVQVPGEYWIVYDVLPETDSRAPRSLGFQFAPECKIGTLANRGFRVERDGKSLALAGSSSLDLPSFFLGSLQPIGGWVSRGYGDLIPAPQVRYGVPGTTRIAAFVLGDASDLERADVLALPLSNGGVQILVSFGDVEDTLLLNLGPLRDTIGVNDLRFEGELAWLRCREGKASILRWIHGKSLEWPSKDLVVRRAEAAPSLEISSGDAEVLICFCDRDTLSLRWPPSSRRLPLTGEVVE